MGNNIMSIGMVANSEFWSLNEFKNKDMRQQNTLRRMLEAILESNSGLRKCEIRKQIDISQGCLTNNLPILKKFGWIGLDNKRRYVGTKLGIKIFNKINTIESDANYVDRNYASKDSVDQSSETPSYFHVGDIKIVHERGDKQISWSANSSTIEVGSDLLSKKEYKQLDKWIKNDVKQMFSSLINSCPVPMNKVKLVAGAKKQVTQIKNK